MKTALQHCLLIALLLSFAETCALAQTAKPLEVDLPQYGQAFAGSSSIDSNALGGFGQNSNVPKANASALQFTESDLYIFVDTSSSFLFKEEFMAYPVYLVNQGKSTQSFAAADSRIHLFAEVYINNSWHSIEYMPWIRCGNSYHQVYLGEDQYWVFHLPVYGGDLPVKMRYRCAPRGDMGHENEEPFFIYSNEFQGSIHPGQLIQQGKSIERN